MTETWLKHAIADISPPGYSFFHEPRADQRTGGGVGTLVSDQLKTDIYPLRSKRSLHVSETIRSVVSLSACIGFKTVHVNFLMIFKIY